VQFDRQAVRLTSLVIVVASAITLAHGAATAPTTASVESVPEAPPREHVTAVTESAKFGTIIAWHPNGSLFYEQHNPDYIPEERGGPAVLVADSENGRVVEYGRTPGNGTPVTDGTWERTWQWRDGRLQWPRDADRLPNGGWLSSSPSA
jgi:hypothetical protein